MTGALRASLPDLQEPPIEQNYLNAFPSFGITFQNSPKHMWSLNLGRRINRPDYRVLNPFREQMSELSFRKGNPFLQPEIVNNAEIGYTLGYRYNFKLAYSRTTNQITRLIGFGVEITKRESAEARLAESEARLANAQRIAHIGNWDWDIVTGDLHAIAE